METSSDGDKPWQSYHTVFTNAKAGMDGVDKEKVQKIVYEMSKGSKYFESEKRKEALIKHKIDNLRGQCALLTEKDMSHYQKIADKRIIELEASRDLSKIWLHSDMDAFYAAVETLENPSLKGKPLAVGSMSMICTANYEARKFGVRAAMPGFIARKLCPDLIFVPPNFEKYTYYSELTRKVFQKYDPDFISSSLDEAYLNITDICMKRGVSSEGVAAELRDAIYEETGLTCSVGAAPNRLLAKVCSDINKPNGQFILPNDREAVITFISSLPIRKIGGIGKVTEHILKDVLGINTCEEMLQKSAFLYALFSQCSTEFFISIGLGLGKTDAPQYTLRKSISCERTFSATDDVSLLVQKLAEIAEALSMDMEKECLLGRTLTLKLKTAAFEVRTRATTLQKSIHIRDDIFNHALKLLKAELPLSLRLIGLRMSQFHNEGNCPLDPMQRTLTSFIISGDASPSSKCSTNSVGSSNCEEHLIRDQESDVLAGEECSISDDDLVDTSRQNESTNFLKSSHQDLDYNYSSKDDADPMKNKSEEEPVTQCKTNCHERINGAGNIVDGEDATLASKRVQPFWIDDCICSVCGVELPPSFIEDKQEHSDFHLAEMLQEEESIHSLRNPAPLERLAGKVPTAREGARKKQKSNPKGENYIPIDAFFGKTK